jgi:hypothetical protein
MGQIFVDLCSEGAGVGLDVDDGRILLFESRSVELFVADIAGGGAEVAKKALLSVLEANVVVASTVFERLVRTVDQECCRTKLIGIAI